MCPTFSLPVDDATYEKSGSKFITFNESDKIGTLYYRDIEVDMPDWDNQGVSIKFPVRITEKGADAGKEAKLSAGVSETAVWKLKDILKAFGVEVKMVKKADGAKHPEFEAEEVAGKAAVGVWVLRMDERTPEEGGKGAKYPKLESILPPGSKPKSVV